MKMILKYTLGGLFFSLLLTSAAAASVLWAFPLEHWSQLYTKTWHDVPFLLLLLVLPVTAGVIMGFIFGLGWYQKLNRIDRQMEELVSEQKITSSDGKYRELKQIEKRLEQLQNKFRVQADKAQKISTKRVEEREKSLQEVVVQERTRLARELHDSVSQQLFAASMLMSAINEAEEADNFAGAQQLKMVENMIHQSQLEMRALLLHLRPVALKGKSLQQGAEELLTELQQKLPLEISWKVEDFTLDKGVEDQLFRILQESVSNTLRHAEASTLAVLLIQRDEWVILRITDDGIGFDATKETKTSSYGLDNMQERAYEIGGTFKLVSLPDEGTRLEIKVPILQNAGDAND